MSEKDKPRASEQKPAPATPEPELTEEQLAEVSGGIIIVGGTVATPDELSN